ncbi:1,4-dihydroxy-2-naphthoate polyprenyltransferase [Paenibacillus turicensis]|uniref:1,4-dihydroxy-2-naphthoate polyprenyltransferase n=1 Tax=Paenibacillus turicensis TaxID=160487 RepID=UPI003D2C281F
MKKFLDLVEIRTKAASMIPFLMGTSYAWFRFDTFQVEHFILMLVSLLSFDMATTAINNYYDYHKAIKKYGYGYEAHNAIVRYKMNPSNVALLIIILLVLAIGAGILLFLHTGWLVLVLGGLSFAVGILYSFGPIPISRMPLGEIFSGLFMGFVIIYISTYIQVGNQLAILTFEHNKILLELVWTETLWLFLVSIPAILCIANIMLANNICDMEEDIENKRYTLPVYIGRENALILFKILYYASFLDLIVLYLLDVSPILLLIALLSIIPVTSNAKQFIAQPVKRLTFKLAVSNFMLTNMSRIVVLVLAAWLRL